MIVILLPASAVRPAKNDENLPSPQARLKFVLMDYARSARRRFRTGPLPTVPWRDLDRKTSIEDHLPTLILLGFGVLAAIQLLLQLSY
jgi:hypothetical protein